MLISEDYKQQQQEMHNNPNYGVASVSFAPIVTDIINKAGFTEILDYGCGKGRLAGAIRPDHNVTIQLYDPGMPGYDEEPEPMQFVTCIDVLEHVEPDSLDAVLDDLKEKTLVMGFFTIHTGPAMKVLPDGRNAHLIQEDYKWWLPKLWDRFDIVNLNNITNGFYVIVRAL